MIIRFVTRQVPVSQILRRGARYATPQFGLIVNSNVKQNVFSLDLKVACDALDCTSLGRELHTVGQTKRKDRLAKFDAT